MLTASGLGSGLDINSMVSQLVAAERAGPDLQLDRKAAKLSSKFSALASLKGAMSSFQSSLTGLNSLANYSKNTISSSNTAELSVTADSSAVANKYSINVSQLAGTHSLASEAFADIDVTTLGTGTLSIRHGTTDYVSGTDTYNSFTLNPEGSVANIVIDSSNNTLDGIMEAINEADVGVNAAIVNDGSGYKLLLTSEATGEENSIEVVVLDDDGDDSNNVGLSRFAFNSTATNLEQTVAAQDSLLTVNGLAISNSSNVVDSAIQGVTLNLKQVSTAAIDVSVAADTTAVINSISSFVAGYNKFISVANALSDYDAEKDLPAALVGDFTLRSVNGQIDGILRSAVAGVTGSITNLSQLGISTNSSGALEVDAAVLNAALEESPQEVTELFAAIGVPEDEGISFSSFTESTLVGDYAVNITTLASSGMFAGTAVLPDFGGGGSLIIDSDNDSFTIEVDGVASDEIILAAGTYTSGTELANEIQAQINGSPALMDVSASVTVSYDSVGDSFSVTSNSLGSISTVNILAVDTNTAAELGFSVVSGVDGNDVAGTIDGVAAVGTGNVLLAGSGTDAEGLGLLVSGTTTGSRGNVNFSRGLANQLDNLLGALLETEGALESRIDSYKDQIDELAVRRQKLELRWVEVEERYMRQFNALDSLLSSLQSTSAYMEEQFSNFVKPNSIQRK